MASPHETIATTQDLKNVHNTLKYSLLGPSLTKAGQSSVDQQKVCYVEPEDTSQILIILGIRDYL